MYDWWRALASTRTPHTAPLASPQLQAPTAAADRAGIETLIDAAFQESARADAKSAALLTIAGICFTAFSAACAATTAVPLHGLARCLSVAALAGICAVVELLLLALRPRLGPGLTSQRYFATWRRYAGDLAGLADELSAPSDMCRLLVDLSGVAWQKYLYVRRAIDLLMVLVPLMAGAVSIALLRL